jgi:hypothetical protein
MRVGPRVRAGVEALTLASVGFPPSGVAHLVSARRQPELVATPKDINLRTLLLDVEDRSRLPLPVFGWNAIDVAQARRRLRQSLR